jgi:hypothetical protein
LVTTPLTNNADGSKLYSGPSNPQRNIPYPTYDLVRGIEKMKASGVRYYLSITAASRVASDSMPDKLRKVGEVGKCPSRTFTPDPVKDATSCFTFYEVVGSQLVSSLSELPQVVKGIDQDQYGGWLDVETEWYNNPTAFPETIAWSGPKDWNRFTAKVDKPEVSPGKDAKGRDRKPEPVRTFGAGVTTTNIAAAKPVEPVTVSNISLNNTDLRFTVDRVGVPVLVKVSYFPNWSVSGAKGPYRVMPNFMVVIPTSKNVHLHYGYSGADALGYTASFAGIAMLGLLHRTRRRPLLTKPEPAVAGERPLDDDGTPTQNWTDDTSATDVPDFSDDALRPIVDELPEDNEHLDKDE